MIIFNTGHISKCHATKSLSTHSKSIQEINKNIDIIARNNAEQTFHEISHDNPDPSDITITYGNLLGKAISGPTKPPKSPIAPPPPTTPTPTQPPNHKRIY